MTAKSAPATPSERPYDLLAPAVQKAPLVFASPHSGTAYPPDFVAASRLDPVTLRRSEDSYVDELFAAAPEHGAPLLRALFPRAFVDPNREALELDPGMFEDALPPAAMTATPRVAAGLGSIARVVATGEEIYARKLSFSEVRERLEKYYRPYHRALEELVLATRRRFGLCLLVDCHSMPSVGGPMERDAGDQRVDVVLGDCHGRSCAPLLTSHVEAVLARRGLRVARNTPYAGGYVTQLYGRPAEGLHALQIEINRGLYMDETTFERSAGFDGMRTQMTELVADLARLERTAFAA